MLLNGFRTESALLGARNGEIAPSLASLRASRSVAVRRGARGAQVTRTSASASGGWLSNKVGSMVDKVLQRPGKDDSSNVHYTATIELYKKLAGLGFVDLVADLKDDASEVLGHRVSVQLVSVETDPKTGKPMMSEEVVIENWVKTIDLVSSSNFNFNLEYYVPKGFGVPGAIIVKNQHPNEFHLVSFSVALPDSTVAHYVCDSWVYNTNKKEGRIFFRNKVYLPSDTPAGLKELREKELQNLRGDGTGRREMQDRIYDYDVYNDIGDPDKDARLTRRILGGNQDTPYPRRCRTGRPPTKANPAFESMYDPKEGIYIPRDERFDHVRTHDLTANGIRTKIHATSTDLKDKLTKNTEFDSIAEIRGLFAGKGQDLGGMNNLLPNAEDIPPHQQNPMAFLKELLNDGALQRALRYPLPQILQGDENGWAHDDEFGREYLAGVNPFVIKRVTEFPIKSKLEDAGDPVSAITAKHIEGHLEGLDVKEAVDQKRLFVADYYDAFYPFVNRINAQAGSKTYASRALFFLSSEQTLKILALELVLPPQTPGGSKHSRVFTPPTTKDVTSAWLWKLAKAHVINNDIFIHQVNSHYSRCHAMTEPFLLATHRQLSALHPVHQLLAPHFHFSMETFIVARKSLINAEGVIESVHTPGKYCMDMSAVDYKENWTFEGQALPNDLINRGMAVPDSNAKHGIRLVVEDYPYAADGLEHWSAIKSWNHDFVDIYYKDDEAVRKDVELNNWWTEARTVGHADMKDAPGWTPLNSKDNLVDILSTIQWVTTCQHAVANFSQYHYSAFMPHRPTATRRLIPEPDTKEWAEFKANPEKFFLSTLSNTTVTTKAMSVYEVLSSHSTEEEYLGQRPKNWTDDQKVLAAFNKFSQKINDVDELIAARNSDKSLKNRSGPVLVPYNLQRPTSKPGLTGRGVPNSITL